MPPSTKTSTHSLLLRYRETVVPTLKERFGITNLNAVPRLEKVVLNIGLGKQQGDAKALETAQQTLTRISGQKPVLTKARKSISGFKLREGTVIGAKVTLRGQRMLDFLGKLVNVTLPRVRDFQGIDPKAFGQSGNYTLGFKENLAFPEIKSDEVERLHGLEVTIVTTAKNAEQGLALLSGLGFPFRTSSND
jgi:large subunit ribosomal protein L5